MRGDPFSRPAARTGRFLPRSVFNIFQGLTLHNEAAPTEELAAFGGNLNHSMERKKVYTKPVPKDFAKAWEKNDGEQEGGGWGGQGQE